MQDQAAAYNGEGQERAANNNGIRHQTEKTMFFGGGHTYFCCEYNMLFLAGVVQFLCVGVMLLTKQKVVHTSLSTTYVKKKQPKIP
jgi:hypothetical protein